MSIYINRATGKMTFIGSLEGARLFEELISEMIDNKIEEEVKPIIRSKNWNKPENRITEIKLKKNDTRTD